MTDHPFETVGAVLGLTPEEVADMTPAELAAARTRVLATFDQAEAARRENITYLPVQGTPLPVMLGGGPVHRCARCARTFTTETYRCVQHLDDDRYRDICRYCADADPDLHHWQAYCDVADAIDTLMRTAPDKAARQLLRAMLTNAAEHFAVWRWPNED